MDSSDMLDPINELMDKYLSTRVSIFASSIGTKGYYTHLDIGSIRTLDQCWPTRVTETGTPAGHAWGTHHCLGDHWTVQIAAHLVIQNLNLDLVQSIRVDAIWEEREIQDSLLTIWCLTSKNSMYFTRTNRHKDNLGIFCKILQNTSNCCVCFNKRVCRMIIWWF